MRNWLDNLTLALWAIWYQLAALTEARYRRVRTRAGDARALYQGLAGLKVVNGRLKIVK